jgi:hypothetical protein
MQFRVTTPRPGLLEWLSVPVEWAARWLDILLLEKRKWTPMPWKTRFRAWRHGFGSFSYSVLELDDNPPEDYLPDLPHWRFGYDINGRYTDSVFSKVAFSHILKAKGAPQPPVKGILLRGSFYPEGGAPVDGLEGIHGMLEAGEKLVLRPSFGGGGTGIFFLEKDGENYLVNSLPCKKATLHTLIQPLSDYLVTGFVKQASYAAEIAPDSTNTLRILTLWDVDKNQPFMAATCHRFGRAGHGPVDSFHAGAGGTSVAIDAETGTLGLAVIREQGRIKRISHHPDTGKPIEGVLIPGWKKTTEELLELAASLPFTPCIGWDLVQLEDGWVCLEGNPFPGLHVWQVHGGILRDPRARRFYREYGMLK